MALGQDCLFTTSQTRNVPRIAVDRCARGWPHTELGTSEACEKDTPNDADCVKKQNFPDGHTLTRLDASIVKMPNNI